MQSFESLTLYAIMKTAKIFINRGKLIAEGTPAALARHPANPQLARTLKMPVGDYLRRLYFDSICFEPAILR